MADPVGKRDAAHRASLLAWAPTLKIRRVCGHRLFTLSVGGYPHTVVTTAVALYPGSCRCAGPACCRHGYCVSKLVLAVNPEYLSHLHALAQQ